MTQKFGCRILVSACLLGQPVRYDGTAKAQRWILDTVAARAELVPICPESEAGLGIPRPPMQLLAHPQGPRLVLVENSALDTTATMQRWIAERLPGLGPLDAAILKARSPSCGQRVPLFDREGRQTGKTAHGLFVQALMHFMPGLLVLDEEELQTSAQQQAFLQRLGL